MMCSIYFVFVNVVGNLDGEHYSSCICNCSEDLKDMNFYIYSQFVTVVDTCASIIYSISVTVARTLRTCIIYTVYL